jgi:hypothetical protein
MPIFVIMLSADRQWSAAVWQVARCGPQAVQKKKREILNE